MNSRSRKSDRAEEQISLHWPGKRLHVESSRPVAQQVEYAPPRRGGANEGGLLLHGDNFDAMSWLLANGYAGTVRLVYLDPPYNSNRVYASRIRLRGKGQPTLGKETAYEDIWQADAYLQFLADRLLLLRQLLHPDGTIWLHCDHRMQAHLLLLLSEVFGPESHLNTVFWRSQSMRGAKVRAHYFPYSAQSIHIFRTSPRGKPVWNPPKREIVLSEKEAAAQFMRDEHGFFRTSDPGAYSFQSLAALFEEGRLYAPYGGTIIVDEDRQQVYASNGGNVGVKYYLTRQGRNRYLLTRPVDNLWDDVAGLGTVPGEDENYPTQKTEKLLQRVLESASEPGDLVLDPFVGSGTTLKVAQQLGRSWIGCDSAWRAVRTTACRLSSDLVFHHSSSHAGKDSARSAKKQKDNASPEADGYRILRLSTDESVLAGIALRERQGTAKADIRLARTGNDLTVRIDGFHSARLNLLASEAQAPLPHDWRRQVRAVLLDTDFDGETMRPALIDAPAGKNDLVAGAYTLTLAMRPASMEAAPDKPPVAVLIVDVAGEEHLFVHPLESAQPIHWSAADPQLKDS